MEVSKVEQVNLHIAGAKDDSKKPRMDLVLGGFPNALWGVGEVGTYGATKYSDNGCGGVKRCYIFLQRYLLLSIRYLNTW